MPWCPEDDIVVSVQRDALAAVRREHALHVETLARLPAGWEEHWQLAEGEYERYYLNVETGEVSRLPPQMPDGADEYSCDLEGEMRIPEGEMYAELEKGINELLRRKRAAAQGDADDAGAGGAGDAELAVQLGELLHAHRRAIRGRGSVAVRPDAIDGIDEGEEVTRWSAVGGAGGRRGRGSVVTRKDGDDWMGAMKDGDDTYGGGGGGGMEGLGRVRTMQNDLAVVARRARHGVGAAQPDGAGGGGGGGGGLTEAEAALDRLAAALGVAPAALGAAPGRRGSTRRGAGTTLAGSTSQAPMTLSSRISVGKSALMGGEAAAVAADEGGGGGGGGGGRRGSTTARASSELSEAILTLRQAVRSSPPPPPRGSTTGPLFISHDIDSEHRPTPQQVEEALSVLRVHLAAANAGRRSAVANVIDLHMPDMEFFEDGGVAPLVAEISEIFHSVSLDKDDLETVLIELTGLCAQYNVNRRKGRGSMVVTQDLDLYDNGGEATLDDLLADTLQ
eukprot:scaffold89722_cov54-Phaeocystis_antarctica.AAC.1